jgi:hypothetical protein
LIISTKNDTIFSYQTIIGGRKLDSITEAFLTEFSNSNNLDMFDIPTRFEHFANYCALSSEVGVVEIDIQDMHTGEAAQGIDGIAIEVNGSIVDSTDDIEALIKRNKTLDVKFIFVQAKTSDSFDNTEIGNFLSFVGTFFSDDATATFCTEEMQKFIEMKDCIYRNSRHMRSHNPNMRLYYVAPGKWNNTDVSLNAVINGHLANLDNTNLFSKLDFIPCGSAEIHQMYRKSKEQIESTFVFSKNVMMFSDENDDYGYSGVLPFSEYIKIICEENGSLKNVFEDNIRDFLGESNYVNSDIEQTVRDGRSSAFCMLNNGITVVANSAILVSDKMTIKNYQIVNGCQTSHVLYLNRESAGANNLLIPIKIIVTEDDELKNRITKATNNQTSITKEQLEALSTFQKTLEEYYHTFTAEDQQLYYERRSGQYRSESISKTQIVTIRAQIKNASSMFNDKPHDAAGHYNSLLKDIGTRLFLIDDQPILYYTSSLALHRFENLIKTKQIGKEYRKGKYQAIMLFKYLATSKLPKHHNAKKMNDGCKQILAALNDEARCLEYFLKVIEYFNEQSELDLADRKLFERKDTTDILLKNKANLISKR